MSSDNDQPSKTDLVSAIGTWLAAGLALIALIGIVGPILVWRATKSERNRALNEVDQEGAETFGYIGRGLWTGHKVRIFRRIRAPILSREPVLSAEHLSLKLSDQNQQPSDVSADWIQFGSLIEGYGIPMPRGDKLVVKDGHAFLPVHSSWILLIGLVGRYGQWQDKGRLPSTIARGIASTQAQVKVPAMALKRAGSRNRRSRSSFVMENRRDGSWTGRPWERSIAPWEDHNDRRSTGGVNYRPMYGLTGTFFFPSQKRRNNADTNDHLFFSRHKATRVGQLSQEFLGVDMLFWLSVGCLPIGDTVICLTNVQDVQVLPETPSISTPSTRSPSISTRTPPPLTPKDLQRRRVVQFDSDSSSEDTITGGSMYHHSIGISPVAYITPQSSDPSSGYSVNSAGPRAFQFTLWNERGDGLSDFSSIVHADSIQTKVISLQEVALSEVDADGIILGNDGTYVARDLPWLRLDSGQRFLRRSDGQFLALALLDLKICPYGYLVSQESSWCRKLLGEAADLLPQLLTRVLWSIDTAYGYLRPDDRKYLQDAMATLYHLNQISSTRRYFDAVFNLDKALEGAIQPSAPKQHIVNVSLGCVMLTSPEFRSIISQSARLLSEGFNGTIEVDLDKRIIQVHTIMSFVSQFPIDFDVLFPNAADTDRTGIVQVPLNKVLLICQRAALRSSMFKESLDSKPLFEAVSRLSPRVYVN